MLPYKIRSYLIICGQHLITRKKCTFEQTLPVPCNSSQESPVMATECNIWLEGPTYTLQYIAFRRVSEVHFFGRRGKIIVEIEY